MKVEVGKSVNEKVDVDCRDCRRATKHLVLASVDLNGSEPMGSDDYYHWTSVLQTVQCQGCEAVSFRRVDSNSEDYVQISEDEYEHARVVYIFPNPNEGRPKLVDAYLLPDQTARIYAETMKALNAGQPVLCGVGVRALIETVCKDKKAKGHDLYSQINDLVSQGVLTKDGADILHKVRTLGNDAAHEVKPHSDEQLGLAMDVVEHLLQGVYILPVHANKTFK
ncbi:DUF4145 domain-containing protein [Pseudomethylobacillus aquaticus]|uniref:DUF4145 domain-containing protein n=1 Tax=Pseudomethylobacillus aquaticus TaxID=2676064 RepID=A0A3N0V6P2_9PROT|nr:DUF4145 domain-containing protein [Pseudomethylobacillus aquaticus]ROH88467.1 DUF4145 domain-containing protein [Pseudomethylobacillus aquaticus]